MLKNLLNFSTVSLTTSQVHWIGPIRLLGELRENGCLSRSLLTPSEVEAKEKEVKEWKTWKELFCFSIYCSFVWMGPNASCTISNCNYKISIVNKLATNIEETFRFRFRNNALWIHPKSDEFPYCVQQFHFPELQHTAVWLTVAMWSSQGICEWLMNLMRFEVRFRW